MERIKLTKTEKQVLRALRDGTELPVGSRLAVYSLEDKDMIRVAWVEGKYFEAVELTPYGRCYLRKNPKLRNPLFNISEKDLPYISITIFSIGVLALSIKLILKAL
mgnify:CR=1 FL=1